ASPDIGLPRVVAVFVTGHTQGGPFNKRRILVEDVVHAQRDGGVIEPCAPTRRTVRRGRDWHDVLLLVISHLRILTRVLGITGNWLGNPWWKVERVVDHQIKGRPFTDFAGCVLVPVLPDVVNDSTGIQTAEIVEQARVPVVSRIRAKSRSYEAAIKIICKCRCG